MSIPVVTGPQQRPVKCVVYGPEGVGKSTWAAAWPRPIFIDTEGSTDRLDVARLPKPTNWKQLHGYVKGLGEDPHGYQTLVIDTADWAERLCAETLCAENGKAGIEDFGYGKGYTYLVERFAALLRELDTLRDKRGMNCVFCAHAVVRKLELPEEAGAYDHWELKCSKQVSPLLKEWAELLAFAAYKTVVTEGKDGKARATGGTRRVLYTVHTAAYDAKNRFGLPAELPLDFAALAAVIPALRPAAAPAPATTPPAPAGTLVDPPAAYDAATAPPPPAAPVKPEQASFPAALYDAMKTAEISEATMTAYLRAKGFMAEKQTIHTLPDSFVRKMLLEINWPKIVAGCRELTTPAA